MADVFAYFMGGDDVAEKCAAIFQRHGGIYLEGGYWMPPEENFTRERYMKYRLPNDFAPACQMDLMKSGFDSMPSSLTGHPVEKTPGYEHVEDNFTNDYDNLRAAAQAAADALVGLMGMVDLVMGGLKADDPYRDEIKAHWRMTGADLALGRLAEVGIKPGDGE